MNARRAAILAVRATTTSLLLAIAVAAAQDTPESQTRLATSDEHQPSGEELIALGAVQAELDEIDAAEASFLEGIELITATDGEFASTLIDAYRGVADIFARRGEFAEAIAVLEQARHVSHRNYGLFNLDQAELLDELSQIFEDAGDTREAQETQREILDVALRHFGGENTGVIPYHYRLAEYYEAARMRGLAREQYQIALDLLQNDPAADPAQLLKPLHEILRIDTILGEPLRSQRRLEQALEAAPAAQPLERAEALAALGDTALVADDIESAMARYREAYATLARDGTTAADAFFAQPRMVSFVPPPGPVDWGQRSNRPYAWGSITVRFTLSALGRAERIQIV
ncbi:MAG: tetratricopeptide repeat protein, partial [Gammaproteobacteria bacterium]|nr:tetratricopeptide repeat protein [Gammaproteobacteria bacterium]